MKKTTRDFIEFLFGKDLKKRYMRIVMLLCIIILSIVLIQNVGCGYDKRNGLWFKWQPVADIEIKKEV